MYISRVVIKNFRNLANVDVATGPRVVLIGENRSGKTNFLHALRLVLDPTLPNSERELRREDFWDGLSGGKKDYDPIAERQSVEVSLEFVGFDDNAALKAVLGDAVVDDDPLTARITYRFAPTEFSTSNEPQYEWSIYSGQDPEQGLSTRLRSYLTMNFLGALRNAEDDIANWRRSPLRELLEGAAESMPTADLSAARTAIENANSAVGKLVAIDALSRAITERTTDIVGPHHELSTELAVGPVDPGMLIRSLRIFVDGNSRRTLNRASLGATNILYFALNEMRHEQRLAKKTIAHVTIAIDEPEAHLHPHLQRLIFRRLLSSDSTKSSVFVTTQSPHIASVADPKSLLRLDQTDTSTATLTSAATAALDEPEWDDLGRYLDATRAEIAFAKKVIFVEGFAEQVLMPRFAMALGMDLDQLGITVCAIHGTHFTTYVRAAQALGIHFAVVTDGDPSTNGKRAGDGRARRIVTKLGHSSNVSPEAVGIFVGNETLEIDLLRTSESNANAMARILGLLAKDSDENVDAEDSDEHAGDDSFVLTISGTAGNIASDREASPSDDLIKQIKKAGGKGRFAQRLAEITDLIPPEHVKMALQYLVADE